MVRWKICGSPALLVVLLGVIVFSFCYQPASYAATLTVCAADCNHATIQAAVNAAGDGDTISVAAGTYAFFDVAGKTLTINGAGAATTIVDGEGIDYPSDISGGSNVTLSGLKFINPGGFRSGVYVNQSTVTIQGCTINNSGGAYFYGIDIDP